MFIALGLGCLAGGAAAETRTIGVFGAWEAFGGATNDGRPVCGVSTSWQDGRYFGIKYWQGQPHFTVQLIKPSWQIPAGTRVPVALQFDQLGPWTANATGNPATATAGGFVEFTVPFNRLENFLREFRYANAAAVTFRQGSEPMWRLSLSGSNAASQAMADCVSRMAGGMAGKGSGEPTQPYGGPSQPYSPAPQTPVGGGKF
ncbi:hypothetical protein JYK14_04365 [Siccirubricoccus sp. KC 17139]|uniref:DUF3304 domain-containing protein n=1 Tax=Siccirubricoccus soli TaxID=2899147 RepID=A0ABT1D0H0_9PROT|nr:hypothetical protein [Siccirubricoccus soli]MCO6415411.1 hypothetical protein [Siccirubricoccus soli]MCP2681543.1 hypothetical protein [Siccirubricoccus soli]